MLRSVGQAIRRRPRTVVLIVALLLLGAAGGGYGYALHQWHEAKRALRERQFEEARRRLVVCRRVWPWSVRVNLLAARVARLSGEVREAEALLNRCLKLQKGPKDDIQLEFYLLRVQMGEEDEVAPALLNCVENKHPEAPLILETLTLAYQRHLRLGPALRCLDLWIRDAPDSARAYQLRGWTRERLSNQAGALKDYYQALELAPDLITVRLRLVEMLLEKADLDRAQVHLDRLREQAPTKPEVLARLGQARLLQGERAEARRLLEAAAPHLPRDMTLLIDLGKLEMQEGRPAQAEEWLRRALRMDPTDPEARYQLVASLREQGRQEEAQAALAQYRKDAELMRRASKLLQDELDHPSNNAGALYELADLLSRSRQEQLAVYWLYQALECDPEHQPANRALAEYYEKKGQLRKAASFRRRLTAAPSAASTSPAQK